MRRVVMMGGCGLMLMLGVVLGNLPGQETGAAKENGIRVGVYDPRAVAVAWARSSHNPITEKMKEYQAAKKANDQEKIAELEKWGPAQQRLLHFQGFGHVPVGDLLQPVREPLRKLLQEKKLVAIAMECDVVAEGVEQVDVTLDLVRLFQPSDQTLEVVEQLREKQPLSLLELADMPADR